MTIRNNLYKYISANDENSDETYDVRLISFRNLTEIVFLILAFSSFMHLITNLLIMWSSGWAMTITGSKGSGQKQQQKQTLKKVINIFVFYSLLY